MVEALCRTALYNACREAEETAPLVALKGKPWKRVNEFENFFDALSSFNFWTGLPINKAARTKPGSLIRKSWMWFNEKADALCKAYIQQKFGGDIRKAMREAQTFSEFCLNFESYFTGRRFEFLKKTDMQIAERKSELTKAGKTPQSHGGVANLLKVLTKTMHEQGSTIVTIAKVQYAVCIQAGIYIPDEFLTDVLVAQEMLEDVDDAK